jgi:transcriptional regulator with XRE-family HTH domain
MSKEASLFGRRLRELRLARQLTQEALAEAAGITSTYTSDIELGKRAPSLTIVLRLAQALDVDVADLLSDFRRENLRRFRFD